MKLPIKIFKDPNADSRTGGMDISMFELEDSTLEHIGDVRRALLFFAEQLNQAGWAHDYTKKAYLEEFHKDFTTLQPGDEFKTGKWYQLHISKERHHLLAKAPDDITLIDVLEYISDCVMAGMARSGSVSDLSLPSDILEKAFANTVNLLKENVILADHNDESSEEEEEQDDE